MATKKVVRRKRAEKKTGRVLTAFGFFLKILQIIGTAFSIDIFGGTFLTLATTCFIVGGLAVISVERLDVTFYINFITIIGIVGAALPTGDYKYSFFFMMVGLLSYGIMLFAMRRRGRAFAGVFVFALCVLLVLMKFGVINLHAIFVTLVLVLLYGAMGVGLFL